MNAAASAEGLSAVVARYGPSCYLLTTSDDGRPHSTLVVVRRDADQLSCVLGRRSALNARARPLVSLLWPPGEPGGYSLIVDGDITVAGESADDGALGTVRATRAVLHRPGQSPDGDGACGSDCLPIDLASDAH